MKRKNAIISVVIIVFSVVISSVMLYNTVGKKTMASATLKEKPVIIVDAGHAALENTID